MPVFKMTVDRRNPPFLVTTFTTFVPSMKTFVDSEDGRKVFDLYKPIVNSKVFKSVWGEEWNYGFSLLLAHYMILWARKAAAQGGDKMALASMGQTDGLLTSWSVGEVSKGYSYDGLMLNEGSDSAWYNLTAFGREYYSLWKQKQPITIGVVI